MNMPLVSMEERQRTMEPPQAKDAEQDPTTLPPAQGSLGAVALPPSTIETKCVPPTEENQQQSKEEKKQQPSKSKLEMNIFEQKMRKRSYGK